jgi:hypothetical protein
MRAEPCDSPRHWPWGRLVDGIGSTGQGVGAATARRIMGRASPMLMAKDVPELHPFIRPAAEVLDRAYAAVLDQRLRYELGCSPLEQRP